MDDVPVDLSAHGLALNDEALVLADDPEQMLGIMTADPGSASADALRLLASWTTRAADDTTPIRR
ncbi:hypothetical protein V6V47_28185 [Micromonospora sp. CPCC 205539]|uniref:hypothetical protein n=1 Tax=Micromonospora sp. CPCC 205539 TaxID=3122408 RepID=UPI002FF006E8